MDYLPCEIVETHATVDAAVIWLHGLGASGHDFVPIIPELKLPATMRVRFVFPHAPEIPVTINGGMVMPAWYDILAMDMDREIDLDQIMVSSKAIIDLIEKEIVQGISSDKIVLAGFSQGGAVTYQTALSYDKPLAGLMALSTYFATNKTLVSHKANAAIPIHIFHGTLDPMVIERQGKKAVHDLEALGYPVSYKSYPIEHELCHQELEDISRILSNLVSTNTN